MRFQVEAHKSFVEWVCVTLTNGDLEGVVYDAVVGWIQQGLRNIMVGTLQRTNAKQFIHIHRAGSNSESLTCQEMNQWYIFAYLTLFKFQTVGKNSNYLLYQQPPIWEQRRAILTRQKDFWSVLLHALLKEFYWIQGIISKHFPPCSQFESLDLPEIESDWQHDNSTWLKINCVNKGLLKWWDIKRPNPLWNPLEVH